MRNCIALIFILLQISFSSAQVLKGQISTEVTGEALPSSLVVADDTLGISADSTGHYLLKLSPGEHAVEFRMISFRSEKRKISLKENETVVLNIRLHNDEHVLDIVVVTAGKFEQRLEDVTVSMEVLKPELVQSKNTVTMEDAVDYIPGVSIIDGQANIRGGSGWSYGAGSRVQLLVDDLPQLTADANDAKWNFLPVENLEQIEVIKGASSVLFGSSALNGVINIRTAYPRDTPVTKINCFAGVYDKAFITNDRRYSLSYQKDYSYYLGMNFFHSRKINRWDLVVGGNYYKDNGYRKGENENRGRINFNIRYKFKTPGLSAGVNFNTMINKETVFFLWKNDTSGAYIPGGNTLSDSKTYRTSIDPFLTYITPGGSIHKLRTRWFNTINKNNTDQGSTADLFYTEYQYQKNFYDVFTLTGGIVNIYSKVKSELYLDHNGDQSAGYVQGDMHVKRLTISIGARAEQSKVDTILDKWTPVFRSGINYHLLKGTYFRASAGQGYRFPSIAERFINTSINGLNIFPNAGLKPEKGLSLEAGLKQLYHIGRFIGYFDASVFQNDYDNMMEFVFAYWGTTPDPIKNFGFKSVNVGKTRIRGYEISIMGEGKTVNDIVLAFNIGYTYLDPRQLTYDSLYTIKIGPSNIKGSDSTDFLKYRNRHMIKGDLDISRERFSIGASVRFTSRMENIDKVFTSDFFNSAFAPGLGIDDYRKYHSKGDWIFDTRLSYNITKNIQCAFIIKNVTNHIFMQRPADMQPPRTFVLQAGVKF